jgi:hypothetical protein
MSGDDLHDLLARAAGTPPVRLDPSWIRAAEARRRWRRRAGTAGLAALVVVAAVAWRAGSSGSQTLIEQPAGPQTSPSSGWQTTTWTDLTWQVPASWRVTESDGPPNAAGPEFFTQGPFMGNIPTGPKCHFGSCAIGNAVTSWPSEGVLAWIHSAYVADPTQPGPGHLVRNVDPGPILGGLECTGHGGTVFHAYRRLAAGTANARRVSLDGCVIGSHSATDAALLQQVSDSIALIQASTTGNGVVTGHLYQVGGPSGTPVRLTGTITIVGANSQRDVAVGPDSGNTVELAPGSYELRGHSPLVGNNAILCRAPAAAQVTPGATVVIDTYCDVK